MKMLVESILNEIFQNYKFYYAIAYRYLKNREDAEDALQNICEKLLHKAPGLRSPENMRNWLAIIFQRESLTILRKRGTRIALKKAFILDGEPPSHYGIPEDMEFYYMELLRDMIALAPAKYQAALWDYYQNRTSLRCAARSHQLQESTLRYWKNRIATELGSFFPAAT